MESSENWVGNRDWVCDIGRRLTFYQTEFAFDEIRLRMDIGTHRFARCVGLTCHCPVLWMIELRCLRFGNRRFGIRLEIAIWQRIDTMESG